MRLLRMKRNPKVDCVPVKCPFCCRDFELPPIAFHDDVVSYVAAIRQGFRNRLKEERKNSKRKSK